MPDYAVKVAFTYPVSAVNARDAFNTVHQVIKMRYIGVHAEGLIEIVDKTTGDIVLKAVLNPDEKK